MYKIGSVADLISGNKTANKVRVKEVEYDGIGIKNTKVTPNIIQNKINGPENIQQSKTNNQIKNVNNAGFQKQKKHGKAKNIETDNTESTVQEANYRHKSSKQKKIKNVNINNEYVDQEKGFVKNIPKNNNYKGRVAIKRKLDSNFPNPKKQKLHNTPFKKYKQNGNQNIDTSQQRDYDYTTNTLFVGNVSLDTKVADLKILFESYNAKVASVRFRNVPISDFKTSKRVAFQQKKFHPKRKTMDAYVIFKSEEDMNRGLKVNGKLFKNFHLRVNPANQTISHDKRNTVFLGNLPLDVEEEDIRNLFECCGEIDSLRVIRDKRTRMGKGIGFVNFKNADSVGFALELKECKLGKRVIRVHPYSNKDDTKVKRERHERFEVRVNKLPIDITKQELSDFFGQCGTVQKVKIINPPNEKPHGFVNFATLDNVRNAINLECPMIRNHYLSIVDPTGRIEAPNRPSVFVKNFPASINENEVEALFKDCGYVYRIDFMTRKKGLKNGIIHFKSEESVAKALAGNYEFGGNNLVVENVSRGQKNRQQEQKNKKQEIEESDSEDEVEDEENVDNEPVDESEEPSEEEDNSDCLEEESEDESDEELEDEDLEEEEDESEIDAESDE